MSLHDGRGRPDRGRECNGLLMMAIREGHYGGVDLSGLHVGLMNRWKGNVLSGKWDVGLLVDSQADDRQFEALKTIVTGQAGGTFADLAVLIGNVLGVERARISMETSRGGESGSVRADNCEFRYTPLKSSKGERTQLLHGALAFRDRIYPGKAEGGRLDRWGIKAETRYGEWSGFDFRG